MSWLAITLIESYQRFVSPYKRFACAYRVRHRRDSCSQFGKRAIARLGLLPGVQLIRRRFVKCHAAKQILDYETPTRPTERRAVPSSSFRDDDSAMACECLGSLAAEACCSLIHS
jgi:putative component of membrane protein insertase Oxa1/YidC/SpoIIIJ protein YidD